MSATDLIKPCFTIFTSILYALLIFVLLKGRKTLFSSSFYALFISTGIGDILTCWHRVLLQHLTSLFFTQEWLMWSNTLPLATITSATEWYINYVQIYGVLTIAINRFSAIAMPIWYKKFWTPKTLKVILLAQWFLPIFWSIPMVLPCCQCIYFDNDIRYLLFEADETNLTYTIADGISEFLICAPTIIVMNVLTVVASVKYRRSTGTERDGDVSKKMKRAELRLAIVGVISSLSYIIGVAFLFTFSVENYFGSQFFDPLLLYNLYYISFDIFTMCNPYLLLFLSSSARAEFLGFLTCNRFEKKENQLFLITTNFKQLRGKSTVGTA